MTLHRYMLNRRLARTTPLPGRVLEIGNGRQRRGLATGATVTLDLSDARRPDVQGDALALPFGDGTFDAVVCCETLQYLSRPIHAAGLGWSWALWEIRRVLKPGGALIVSLPHRLASQPDEIEPPRRWSRVYATDSLGYHGFTVERVAPLWPPLRAYTSGWFVEARAA